MLIYTYEEMDTVLRRTWDPSHSITISLTFSKILQRIRLTERKACTISALIELSGLSLITTKICSSFSKLIKLPNQERFASLEANKHAQSITANR